MKKNTGIAVAAVAILLFFVYRISNMKLLGYGKGNGNRNGNGNGNTKQDPENYCDKYPDTDKCRNPEIKAKEISKTKIKLASKQRDYANSNGKIKAAILSDKLEKVDFKEVNTPIDNPLMKGGADRGVANDHEEHPVLPMTDSNLPVDNCANGLNNDSPYISLLTGSPLNPTAILQFLSKMRNGFATQNGCEFLKETQWKHHSDLFETTGSSTHIGNPNDRAQNHAKLNFLTATIRNCCESIN